ncbi:MAG: flagellar basal body rod protein FlgC [Polyangiaceae bacterium]|nr:flagellar basal body rod protein FlgC [Polyangiaceae bacterium]
MLGVFSALEISASGLAAERIRMNTTASNLANARTTRTDEGGAYRRIDPVFEAQSLNGVLDPTPSGARVSLVRVARIATDDRPGQLVHDPSHPDADARGYVEYPNVNVVEEMVNMIAASRAYEAGVTSIEAVKGMARSALGIAK